MYFTKFIEKTRDKFRKKKKIDKNHKVGQKDRWITLTGQKTLREAQNDENHTISARSLRSRVKR